MTIFTSKGPLLAPPPDDKTIPQFLLDIERPLAPDQAGISETPWFIDEKTGREVYSQEIQHRTNALARALKALWKIDDGDVVLLSSLNHLDFPICIWAIHRAGAIVASVNPLLTASELAYQIKLVEPKVIFAHRDSLSSILQALEDPEIRVSPRNIIVIGNEKETNTTVSIDAVIQIGSTLPKLEERSLAVGEARSKVAFLAFSSGTTGPPKAVALSHYNVICNILQLATFHRIHESYTTAEKRRFRPGDRCTGVLPMFHNYGMLVNLHFMLYSRLTLVIAERFNFPTFLQSISRYRISHLLIVPPMVVLLCKDPSVKKADLSSVRYALVGAAPLSTELTQQFLTLMPNMQFGQGYGMTENTAAASIFPPEQTIGTHGSAGQLVSGTIAKVVKEDGTLAGVGERGELYIKGGQVVLGYYRNPKATAETFIDGWLRTGDEVLFDNNGDLFVVDRVKELIKVKGFQVAPAELEGHLLDHPDVADACVIGIPDDMAGEVPLAYIVLHPDVATRVRQDQGEADRVRQDIFEHVSRVKSKPKWLTGGVVFIEEIPKSPSGKILRRHLRDNARSEVRIGSKL